MHNEAIFLPKCVKEVALWAERLSQNYLIVIAEDGSVDGSYKLALELENSMRNVKVIHNDSKLGRGRALKNVMKSFEADMYSYVDVDLATDMKFFPTLVNSIRIGYDIATGSRYVRGAFVKRPPLRLVISKLYNWIIRHLFKTGIFDHQCGFKAFSRKFVDEALQECVCDDWFWDAEILILGKKRGYKILEFPVYWIEKKSNKTSLIRLIRDIRIHGTELLKVLWEHRRKSHKNKGKWL